MKRKEFDAVQMMRNIRDELSRKYLENPEAEDADLKRIRERYGIARPLTEATASK